jgi:hypothetical protein
MSTVTRRLLPLLVLVLAACGSPTATTPATAAPKPSATPVSAAAILASFHDPAFAFEAHMSGEIKVANVTLPVSGKSSFRAGDSYSLLIINAKSGRQRTERIAAGATVYVRSTESGPWFSAPGPTDSGNWGAALARLGALTEQNRLSYNGKRARAFITDARALTASQLGIPARAVANVSGTMTLYVDDPGNLLGFLVDVAWKQPGPSGAAIDGSMNLDYSITARDPTIAAPDEIWKRVTSTHFGYSIGFPVDMEVAEGIGSKPDVFRYPDMFAMVARQSGQPMAGLLSTYVTAYIDATHRELKVRPESQTDIVIAGHPGKALRYQFLADGEHKYRVVGLTLNGRNGYFVAVVGHAGDEEVVDALFEDMIGTFAITAP